LRDIAREADRSSDMALGASKYGPLCLGLAGPFQSICITGEPRAGKKLLVLDIDHTIYDPSDCRGARGSVLKSDDNGFYGEELGARCRPGLHEFLTDVYKEYDIMVWSASTMTRILTLLQQLGMCGVGHSDYKVVAVLDINSMGELAPTRSPESAPTNGCKAAPGALIQAVTVPPGAIPGQQIEVRSARDGASIVVSVPASRRPGDEFHVTIPGAISSISEEYGVSAEDVELAIQLSMGAERPASVADSSGGVAPGAPVAKARKKGKRVKALSLVWACHEFSHLYSETNTVIVDDTLDVCSANPRNSIQCTRYFLQDHKTDVELSRLRRYLMRIAQANELPASHSCWRDGI